MWQRNEPVRPQTFDEEKNFQDMAEIRVAKKQTKIIKIEKVFHKLFKFFIFFCRFELSPFAPTPMKFPVL